MSSANTSFVIIASKRQLLPKARLERCQREADEQGLDLAEYLVHQGELEAHEVVSIVRARARHGRTCTACGELTYMLPGDVPGKTPCEHCGGKLEAGPPQPKTGRPVVAAADAAPPPIPGMSATVRADDLDDRTPVPDDRTPNPDEAPPAYSPPAYSPPAYEPPSYAPPSYEPSGGVENPYGAPESDGAPWAGQERRPTHSLWQEIGSLILFPVKTPQAIALITVGAIFTAIVQGLGSSGGLGLLGVGCCGLLGLGIYIWMFLIDVTREGAGGGSEVPAFPDFDLEAVIGSFVRVLSFHLACYLPVFLLFCAGMSFAPDAFAFFASRQYNTIGDDAHLLSSDKQPLKGQSAADATFYTPDNTAIDLSGKWTVLGLLEMDDADDTGMSTMLSDMPTGSVFHGYQIYDLDRVGRAFSGKVNVIAAYADPRKRLLTVRWPFTIPEYEREELIERFGGIGAFGGGFDEGFDEEFEEDLGEATDLATTFGGGMVGAVENPFMTVKFATTEEHVFPAPFQELRRFPAVYVLDPTGKIVREYSTGVYDEKLYADIQSLMRGGDGDAWAQSLPGHVYAVPGEAPRGNSAAVLLMLVLVGVAVLFGLVYYPMAYLLMVVHDSPTSPWIYPLAFRSMINTAGDYLGLLVIGGGILVLSGLVNLFLGIVFVSAPALLQLALVNLPSAWLAFYSNVAVCYAAGRFYYLNQDRLEWL